MEIFPFKGKEDESTRVPAALNMQDAVVRESVGAGWLTGTRCLDQDCCALATGGTRIRSTIRHGGSPLCPAVRAALCKKH